VFICTHIISALVQIQKNTLLKITTTLFKTENPQKYKVEQNYKHNQTMVFISLTEEWLLFYYYIKTKLRSEYHLFNLFPAKKSCYRRAQTETERAPKISGSKFIKQTSSNSMDSCPKAEPQEQRGLSLYTIKRLQKWGVQLVHTSSHVIILAALTSGSR
jgi:hypothetical protein